MRFFLLDSNYSQIPFGGKPTKKFRFPGVELLVGILLMVHLMSLGLMGGEFYQELAVWCSPHSVQAVVTHRYSRTEDGNTSYYLEYSYSAGGETYKGEDWVSREFYLRHEEGDQVSIQTAAFDPAVSAVEGQQAWVTMILGTAVCLACAGLMVWILARLIRERRRHAICLARGHRLEGTAAIKPCHTDAGVMIVANYFFDSPLSGRRIEGRETLTKRSVDEDSLPEVASVHLLFVDEETHMML